MKLEGYDLSNAEFLGEGSYGKVFRVQCTKIGEKVALKQINMAKIKEQQLEDLLKRQIYLMKELKSPYTLNLIEDSIG